VAKYGRGFSPGLTSKEGVEMLLKKERVQVVEYCLKLIKAELTNGTSGNISIFNRKEGLIAISPTGVEYSKMTFEDVSVVDLKGQLLDGKNPSSEIEMHSLFYRRRKDINAVIHAHTIYCTTIACLRQDLPAVDYMLAIAGGNNVRCAKYATYGTPELAENCYKSMEGRNAVLLANHGLTCGANNIKNALNIAIQVEYCAELYVRAKSIGEPVILPDEEMKSMLDKFKSYGQIK